MRAPDALLFNPGPGLQRPTRRLGSRSLLPLVGNLDALGSKESALWLEPTQGWAHEEIGLGVARCPATFGDHQWPTYQAIRFRLRLEHVVIT